MTINFPFDRLRQAGRTVCAIEIDVRDPEAVSAARSLIKGVPDWVFDVQRRNIAIRCKVHSMGQSLDFAAWASDATIYQKPDNEWGIRDYFLLSDLLSDGPALTPVSLDALL